MSVIQGNAFSDDDAVDTGDIGHSLRCRSAASAYLSKTFSGTPTDLKSQTQVYNCKRSKLGVLQYLYNQEYSGAGYPTAELWFQANDTLRIGSRTSGVTYGNIDLVTTRVFRDPTAHMQIQVVFDTPNATAADRVRLYINGVRETAFTTATYPAHNFQVQSLSNVGPGAFIGSKASGVDHFDGYLSRICFVDGTALTPSSFGQLNTEINEWVSKSQSAVKAVVDAGGTNSFMLDFDDATSLTTLGYDKSSKGNNWTLNGFSLTAGTTYDHMLDVPGNSFATLNPLDAMGTMTLTEGNLKGTQAAASHQNRKGTVALPTTGKWYWEQEAGSNTGASSVVAFGVANSSAAVNAQSGSAGTFSMQNDANHDIYNGVTGVLTGTGGNVAAGVIRQVAYDADTGKLWFGEANVFASSTDLTSGNPSAGTGQCMTLVAGEYFPYISCYANSLFMNFGQRPFAYTPPTGFKALCQANLPEPAILNPKLHFDIKTRTGTAATYSVTGLGFQPDLLWSKSRGRVVDHALYDSVRGVQKQLESNTTGAETTETTGLTAFNSDGYTGGALDQINGTTATNSFVDWLWKAGGAAASNTAGSITSQVSANVAAGFSIVAYTGNFTAGATVGHGLGTAPKMVIIKNRSSVFDWPAFHLSAGAANVGLLNLTNAFGASSYFNSAAPTSSVFALGAQNQSNQNASLHVAYCFADIEGYSKAFSYTGNGSADGPYVHLGFKPRWILVKCSSNAGLDWFIWDTARDTYNQVARDIYPNVANAEELNSRGPDVTSSGFKLRNAATYFNGSGYTYIGFAIADVAGKYSLGR